MLWIGLHLPWLALESFASTLRATQQGLPLALLDGTQLSAVNTAAAALGLKPGLKRATALALAPQLIVGQADALRDAQALQAVAHAALAFTPSVALHGAATVLLEVQPSLRVFGGLPGLLARLHAALAPLAHRLHVASAPTALGAALLAQWPRTPAADPAQPPSLAALRSLLDGAPVWLLGPGREHWEALQGMGLRTLADLRALPRSGLARRFGQALLLDLDRARGDAPDPHDWVVLPEQFESRLELFARADSTDQVLYGAATLLARLVAWARARQARVARFRLEMHHEPRHRADDKTPASTVLEVALADASNDPAHLQLLLRERLARLPLPAPTLELRLHCQALVHSAAPSGELFPSRTSERDGLTRLLERLQARLGAAQVQRLRLVADHRPERATAMGPVQGAPHAATASATASATISPPGPHLTRPVWLEPEPQPLHERGLQPLLDGRPLQLLAGPERIETAWWDGGAAGGAGGAADAGAAGGTPTARDYFVAQASDGSLVWVYRARLPHCDAAAGWFLHGRFA